MCNGCRGDSESIWAQRLQAGGDGRTSVDVGGDIAAPPMSGPMPEAAAATCCFRVGYMPAAMSAAIAAFESCACTSAIHHQYVRPRAQRHVLCLPWKSSNTSNTGSERCATFNPPKLRMQ